MSSLDRVAARRRVEECGCSQRAAPHGLQHLDAHPDVGVGFVRSVALSLLIVSAPGEARRVVTGAPAFDSPPSFERSADLRLLRLAQGDLSPQRRDQIVGVERDGMGTVRKQMGWSRRRTGVAAYAFVRKQQLESSAKTRQVPGVLVANDLGKAPSEGG